MRLRFCFVLSAGLITLGGVSLDGGSGLSCACLAFAGIREWARSLCPAFIAVCG